MLGLIAPDAALRRRAARALGEDRCLVVHLSAPIEVCRQRDPSGQYSRADAGEIANFPGVSAPYDPPENPDLVLPTHELSIAQCIDRLVELLETRGII